MDKLLTDIIAFVLLTIGIILIVKIVGMANDIKAIRFMIMKYIQDKEKESNNKKYE